jgi:hypothetical protein
MMGANRAVAMAIAMAGAVAAASCSTGSQAASEPGQLLGSGYQILAPLGFAVNTNGIFFLNLTVDADADTAATALERLPLSGGTATVLDPSVDTFVLGPTDLYATDTSGIVAIPEEAPEAGASPTTLVSSADLFDGMATSVLGLTLANGQLSWLAQSTAGGNPGSWLLFWRSAQVGASGVSESSAPGASRPCAITSDTTNVYWLDCAAGELVALPVGSATASPTVLAKGLVFGDVADAGPDGGTDQLDVGGMGAMLAAAGGKVFWGEASGAIRAVAATGGPITTLATDPLGPATQVLSDGSVVYWLDAPLTGQLPTVSSVPASGGTVVEVINPGGGFYVSAIAIDADHLYFSDENSIRSVAR